MRTIAVARETSTRAPCLIVMLPGMGDDAERFVEHGFADAVMHGDVRADVLAVDAYYAYYRRRVIVDRLHEDVLAPARRAGYTRIVLLGISMGGVGAVSTARLHPEDVDAVMLLAPYLGPRSISEHVRDAGGLAQWSASDDRDFFELNWTWLRGYAEGARRPPMFIGYGADDHLAATLALVTPSLPAENVSVIRGPHGFVTWRPIFSAWVAGEAMRRACDVGAEMPQSSANASAVGEPDGEHRDR